MGALYPGEHGTVSYLNPTEMMSASRAERVRKKAKGRRNSSGSTVYRELGCALPVH